MERIRGAARYAPGLSLALLFVALTIWSWRRWTDPHIDFGNELYVAWRLAEGDVLYRDLAQRNGPLSPYWNALLFHSFGVSLRTLVVANLAVLATLCAMIHRVLRLGAGHLAAWAGVAVLLGVFGFAHYAAIGNFNYVTPYHHAQVHGLVLCVALLLAWERLASSGRARWAFAAGVAFGGVFLTKAELFVPAALLAAAGALARLARVGSHVAPSWREALGFGAGALALPAAFAAAFLTSMPADVALHGLLGNFSHLGTGVLADPFYRRGAGLDAPVANTLALLRASLGLALFAGACALADRLGRASGAQTVLASVAGGGLLALLLLRPGLVDWSALCRALPAVAAAGSLGLAIAAWRARDDVPRARQRALLGLWSLASLGLLAKMLLAARVPHYGFTLAMPATLLAVVGAVAGLPAWLRARGQDGRIAQALALAAVAGFGFAWWQQADRLYAHMHFELGPGSDAIRVADPKLHPRSRVLAETLAWLEQHTPPDSSLLVMPEGVMLNYWLRRENPTRFNLFLPTEIEAFGEPAMLADLAQHPPDYLVLAHRLPDEFGVGAFGADPRNGQALLAFVNGHYRRVAGFGPEPFRDQGFGTRILAREPKQGGQGAASDTSR